MVFCKMKSCVNAQKAAPPMTPENFTFYAAAQKS